MPVAVVAVPAVTMAEAAAVATTAAAAAAAAVEATEGLRCTKATGQVLSEARGSAQRRTAAPAANRLQERRVMGLGPAAGVQAEEAGTVVLATRARARARVMERLQVGGRTGTRAWALARAEARAQRRERMQGGGLTR